MTHDSHSRRSPQEHKLNDSFTYTVSDSSGATHDATVTITVTGVNDAPIGISLSSTTLLDTAPAGTVIAEVSAIDADHGDSHTFELVNDPSNRFVVVGDELRLDDPSGIQAGDEFLITLRGTDAAGLSIDQVVRISVVATPVDVDVEIDFATISANHLILRRNGNLLEIVDNADGTIVRNQPIAGTNSVRFSGTDESSESLTVDFESGGFFAIPGNIVFNAGSGIGRRNVRAG